MSFQVVAAELFVVVYYGWIGLEVGNPSIRQRVREAKGLSAPVLGGWV